MHKVFKNKAQGCSTPLSTMQQEKSSSSSKINKIYSLSCNTNNTQEIRILPADHPCKIEYIWKKVTAPCLKD